MQETQETQVPSLGQEGTLEECMATHSSILAWRVPWTEESGEATVLGGTESDMTEHVHTHTHTHTHTYTHTHTHTPSWHPVIITALFFTTKKVPPTVF